MATEPDNVLRKTIPLCAAVGKFDNDENGAGTLNLAYFRMLVDNQAKKPRQIPIYDLIGKDDAQHPDDLDQWEPDGWVEKFYIQGDRLMGDIKVMGATADRIRADKIRGASIGTVHARDYEGDPMGSALAHVVLTNKPYVTGMNIAAARAKGGEPIAHHFTALTEADMAEKKEKPEPASTTKPGEAGDVNLVEKVTALESLVAEKDGIIAELTASRDNLLEEVKEIRKAPQLDLALKEVDRLKRHNQANDVRRLVGALVADGQINMEAVRGWYDHDSNEVVLAGFKASQFKGDLKLVEYHRISVPKRPRRQYASGAPVETGGAELTAEERKSAEAFGKDPALLEKTRGASNFTDWQKRRKAAGKE